MERKLITDGFNDLGRLRRSTAKKEASRIEVIIAVIVSLIIIKYPDLNIKPQQIITCSFFVFVCLFVVVVVVVVHVVAVVVVIVVVFLHFDLRTKNKTKTH